MSTPDTRTGRTGEATPAPVGEAGQADGDGAAAQAATVGPTTPQARPKPARKASSLSGWGAPRTRPAKTPPAPAPAPGDTETAPAADKSKGGPGGPAAPVAPVAPTAAAGIPARPAPPPSGAETTQKVAPLRPPARPPTQPGAHPRRARLVLARVDPWSVMKLAFLLSIAVAIVTVVAVVVLWSVLDGIGAFDAAADSIRDITETEGDPGFQLMDYAGLSRVIGVTTVLACVNIVLLTALATLGAFLYNLSASLVGGLHVTLTESD